MEKKPEDYFYLYLGCNVMVESVATASNNASTSSSATGPFKLKGVEITGGIIQYLLEGYTLKTTDIVKPILRPLTDITVEEATEVGWMGLFSLEHFAEKHLYKPTSFHYLLSRGFDLLGFIEAGLAIDGTKM